MFKLEGKIINVDAVVHVKVTQDINGTPHEDLVSFPPGFFRDAANRQAYGVIEVADPVGKDPEFYSNATNADGTITSTAKPLPMVLDALWTKIKGKRDGLKSGGYTTASKWFHSDADSRIQQIGLVMMGANIPAGLQWKTMDGSFVAMTQTLAGQVFAAAAAQDGALFTKAEQHHAALAAMADVDTMAAYDWRAGWPQVYADTIQH